MMSFGLSGFTAFTLTRDSGGGIFLLAQLSGYGNPIVR